MYIRFRENFSDLQNFCYDRNMICKDCFYKIYNDGNCQVKNSIKSRIKKLGLPKRFKGKGIIMDDHNYEKAVKEYESKLFDGPDKTEEELEEEYEEEMDYRIAEAEYQMDELWMERNI